MKLCITMKDRVLNLEANTPHHSDGQSKEAPHHSAGQRFQNVNLILRITLKVRVRHKDPHHNDGRNTE